MCFDRDVPAAWRPYYLRLVQTILQDGFALITSTVLRGRTVLRTCSINPRTTESDIEETLRRMDRLARQS